MSSTVAERRKAFRRLLDVGEIVMAPSCVDPLTARLVQHVGFPAVHVSGSVAHRTAGYADVSLLTMHEMVRLIMGVADATELAIVADGDTGFGSPVNTIRTVKEYERAGAAAMHIEDQLSPKRPYREDAQDVDTISRQEMVDKIRAAVDARTDENLLIIARSEVKGNRQEVLDRLAACVDAGAQAAWIGGARTVEEVHAIRKAVGSAYLFGVLPGSMTTQEFGAGGANCAVLPGPLQIAALHAQRQLLEELKRTGSPRGYMQAHEGIDEMRRFYSEQGTTELEAIEAKYGGSAE